MNRRVHRASVGRRDRAMHSQSVRSAVGLLLFATLLGVVYVWTRVQVIDLRYELRGVQLRVAKLQKRIAQSESEVATLHAVERLTKIATEELHLVKPSAGQHVVVQGRTP